MSRESDRLKGQRELPAVALRVVKPGSDPRDPLKDRIDLEATAAVHKRFEDLGRLPRLLQGTSDTMTPRQIIPPTPEEVMAIEKMHSRPLNFCGGCARFDYEAGQRYLLEGGGCEDVMDASSTSAVKLLGDWKKYGLCSALNALCDWRAPRPSQGCEHYTARGKGVFGRMIGGVWRRLTDF